MEKFRHHKRLACSKPTVGESDLLFGLRELLDLNPLHKEIELEVLGMNIRPLYDRIVVKRLEEKETVSNGIIIPDSAKEKPQEGEVVAVGQGKRLDDGKLVPLELKAGDRILFGKYSGSDIKVDGQEYLIMREDEVLGIIPTKAPAPAPAGKKK
jgi:chaperonin GroES